MMQHLFSVFLVTVILFGVTGSGSPFEKCGMNTAPPKNSARLRKQITNIVGGEEAITHGWPWQVIIYRDNSAENGLKKGSGAELVQHCGGSIISKDYILTAAHCIFILETGQRLTKEELVFSVGRHDLHATEPGSQTFKAQWIKVHGGYKWPDLKDDIAIVKVKNGPIVMSKSVRSVCIPNEAPKVGQVCCVTGWGLTEDDTSSQFLKQVSVPITSEEYCAEKYMVKYQMKVTNNQICAGGKDKKDSCGGDSGGPLVCRKGNIWYLAGIVSYGPEECGLDGFPGVYTRVAQYRDWIKEKSGVAVPS